MSEFVLKKAKKKPSIWSQYKYSTVNISRDDHELIKKIADESGIGISKLLSMMIHFSVENMVMKEETA